VNHVTSYIAIRYQRSERSMTSQYSNSSSHCVGVTSVSKTDYSTRCWILLRTPHHDTVISISQTIRLTSTSLHRSRGWIDVRTIQTIDSWENAIYLFRKHSYAALHGVMTYILNSSESPFSRGFH